MRPKYKNITSIRVLSAEEREAYQNELEFGADKQALDILVACGYNPSLFAMMHAGKFESDADFMQNVFSDGSIPFPYTHLAVDLLSKDFFEVDGHYFISYGKPNSESFTYTSLAIDLQDKHFFPRPI
ncbi:MAG TPA: hypothetical protein VJI98_05520 [Candidatus Nanoarchaeia archaeon]|nr:hypothetical protein [Candidatus Nanoarchaeia archaeon]